MHHVCVCVHMHMFMHTCMLCVHIMCMSVIQIHVDGFGYLEDRLNRIFSILVA
jgi:hypothetical protein